jgi:hypothetical protein
MQSFPFAIHIHSKGIHVPFGLLTEKTLFLSIFEHAPILAKVHGLTGHSLKKLAFIEPDLIVETPDMVYHTRRIKLSTIRSKTKS